MLNLGFIDSISNAQDLMKLGYDNSLIELISTYDSVLYVGEINYWKDIQFIGIAQSKQKNYLIKIELDTSNNSWKIKPQGFDSVFRYSDFSSKLNTLNSDSLEAIYKLETVQKTIKKISHPSSYFIVYLDNENSISKRSIEVFNKHRLISNLDRQKFSEIYSECKRFGQLVE